MKSKDFFVDVISNLLSILLLPIVVILWLLDGGSD